MTGSGRTLKMRLAVGSALLALTLLAMGLPELRLPPGSAVPPSGGAEAPGLPLPPPWLVLVIVGLVVLAVFLLGFWLLQALLSRRRKGLDELARERPHPGPLAQALALLITALLLGGLVYGLYHVARLGAPAPPSEGMPSVESPPPQARSERTSPPPPTPRPAVPSEVGRGLRSVLVALRVLAALGVVALWLHWRRARSASHGEASQQEELAARAGRAAEELAQGGELGDVVLRCYRDMVAILTRRAEMRMTPEMTVREFADRLRALGLADGPVDVLTELFERVRYGGEGLGEPERRRAVEALRAIERRFGPPETASEEAAFAS